MVYSSLSCVFTYIYIYIHLYTKRARRGCQGPPEERPVFVYAASGRLEN